MRSDSSHLAHSFILSLVQFTKCLLSKYLLLLGAGGDSWGAERPGDQSSHEPRAQRRQTTPLGISNTRVFSAAGVTEWS